MFLSHHTHNYTTQKYISETLQMIHTLEQSFEILWKRRSEPSAESVDMASKLPPWKCSLKLEDRLRRILHCTKDTQFWYPVEPLDMLRLRISRVPKDFHFWHNLQDKSKCSMLIVPPNLQKHTHQNVVNCFLEFFLQDFLILPRLHFKSWFPKLSKD